VQDIGYFALLFITQFVMLAGLLGLVVPVYPGLVIMWLAALGYGVIQGFGAVGIWIFVIQTVLMLIGSLVDNLMMAVGGRQGGASWGSILVAIAAGILGTLFVPPIGGIIAAPLAVMGLEYLRLRDWKQAWLALRGMATGLGLSFFIRFGIGIVMMGLWWIWVWKG
jgi:uncharacterized protein YqgC (DUF456 family)